MTKTKKTTAMKARYLIISILLLAACQQIEEPFDPRDNSSANKDGVYTLTIQATKSDAVTKALSLDGSTLNAYWIDTEQVRVFRNGSYLGALDVYPVGDTKPLNATLTGTDPNFSSLASGDELMLLIPKVYTSSPSDWFYTGQNGALTGASSVETMYDYATATVTVNTSVEGTITTSDATFTNEQSIYRFGFKVGGSYIRPSDFTISSVNGTLISSRTLGTSGWTSNPGSITVTPTVDSDVYYVALRNENTDADGYNFVIHVGSALYMASINSIAHGMLTGQFNSAKSIPTSQPKFGPTDASGTVGEQSGVL